MIMNSAIKTFYNFRLTAFIPYLEICELVRHWALCFMPHVTVSSTAGPEDGFKTVVV